MMKQQLNDFYNLLPGIWCEVNARSQFTYVNQEYCNLVGVQKRDSLIGKTVANLPCDASECAEIFWKEDKKVIETGKEQRFLNIVKLANNEWKVINLNKKPIYNEDSQLSSILYNITVQYDNFMQDFGIKMAKALEIQVPSMVENQYSICIENSTLDKISKKEGECLFFLIHGKTYKEIAEIQGVAPRTITDHIERLKFKLHCNSKSELISRAIELGYNHQIPSSLFTKQISLCF